jgi:hypothetical protein
MDCNTAQAPVGRARWRPLTSDRAIVLDVVHFARRIPVFPVERTFDLARLAALRAATRRRIAWSVIFLKAYALVAARHPILRRSFVRWPWPHFVESPDNVGQIVVQREHEGESRLCWARFMRPEKRKLAELNGHLRWYQNRPLEQAFARQILFSRMPLALRRLLWWWNLEVAGAKRASRLGTFSISSLAGQHCLNRGHPSLLTTSLTYGPLDEDGQSVVTLLCDHRVLDGVPAAAALAELESVLQGQISRELASLPRAKAA